MSNFPRYAIYYAPPAGTALDRFGAHLLGYDAWVGAALPFPDSVMEKVPDWRDLSEDPRKYGFHATLKAPLSLANGETESELLAACADFADQKRPIPVIAPVVSSLSGFIAVIPEAPSNELELLAAECVRTFDCFRAPLTSEERARRRPHKLTPRQVEYLDRWGYPYVMEEFRFHMTLTGRLSEVRHEEVLTMLRSRFARLGLKQLEIDRIALFKQTDHSARFTIIGDWPLRAA